MSAWAERHGLWQRRHAYVLACKGVEGEEGLRPRSAAMYCRPSAVAKTLFDGLTSRDLVCELFDDQVALRDDVLAVVDEDAVNHLGFQIHEPLDLWLEGLPRWAPRFECEIVGVKRFTASEAFRGERWFLRRDGTGLAPSRRSRRRTRALRHPSAESTDRHPRGSHSEAHEPNVARGRVAPSVAFDAGSRRNLALTASGSPMRLQSSTSTSGSPHSSIEINASGCAPSTRSRTRGTARFKRS